MPRCYDLLERESGLVLGALRSTTSDCAAASDSLLFWFLWRAQNAIYHGSGYSKGAGNVRSLNSCPERRANQICCSFGDLLNPSELLLRMVADWPSDDTLVGAAATVSFFGP